MRFKPMIFKTVLTIEMCIFGYLYICGKNGLQWLTVQKNQLYSLGMTIEQLQEEVSIIENEMRAWEANDFYKEKIAREQLQMARKGDKLFYIGS